MNEPTESKEQSPLDARYMNSIIELSHRLPPEVVYACGLLIMAKGTTGIYSSTDTTEVTAVEVLQRYMQNYIISFENNSPGGK